MPENTPSRNAWYMSTNGIHSNVHGTIILNGPKLGNQMCVNSNVANWKYIHIMDGYTQQKRMNYSYS